MNDQLYGGHCLWKEILSQQRIRHFKILQSIYFAYDVGIISPYSNRIFYDGLMKWFVSSRQRVHF